MAAISSASTNWFALKKQLETGKKKKTSEQHSRESFSFSSKRQKLNRDNNSTRTHALRNKDMHSLPSTSHRSLSPSNESHASQSSSRIKPKDGESLSAMQQMVLGLVEYNDAQKLPGKYLAIDCEMVGMGLNGEESSLARVSMVNFYGAIILDEFVRQKERVVDYRTQYSGIRSTDMIKAKPFEEVQKKVSDLLKDRILVGHALHNDFKALLLSHPRASTRDTQYYAHKFNLCKTSRVALRNLVKDELGLTIQSGEHSSVTDARASMAVYRLHKKEWETVPKALLSSTSTKSDLTIPKKRKRVSVISDTKSESDAIMEPEETPSSTKHSKREKKTRKEKEKQKLEESFPGGGRKGVSSGLSTIVRKKQGTQEGGESSTTKSDWWKKLPNASALI